MRTDVARAVGTVAIWSAVATELTNLEVHAPPHMMVELMVGITAFLATGAAFGTCAIGRSPRAGRRRAISASSDRLRPPEPVSAARPHGVGTPSARRVHVVRIIWGWGRRAGTGPD